MVVGFCKFFKVIIEDFKNQGIFKYFFKKFLKYFIRIFKWKIL